MASAVAGLSGDDLVQGVLLSKGDAAYLFGANALLDEGALKKAYKMMALRTHPDKNAHPSSHEAFQLVQQAFEMTLMTLQSKSTPLEQATAPTATKSTTAAGTPKPTSKHTKPSPSAGGPPPPPSWWGSSTSSATRFSGNNYSTTNSQSQQPKSGVGLGRGSFHDDIAEVPLPPDIFSDCCDASFCPPRPLPTVARQPKPLPTLDISESEDDGETNKRGAPGTVAHEAEQRHTVSSSQTGGTRRKHQAGSCSLKELFGMFDISDDENGDKDGLPIPSSAVSLSRCSSAAKAAQMRGKEASSLCRPSSSPFNAISGIQQKVVSCPFCFAREFPAHIITTVLCSSCSARFVPAGVRGMSTDPKGSRSDRRAAGGELCACGKTRKGACFLCE